MTLSEKVAVPAEVMARTVGDETVILNLATGTYYALDPVGARIWELLAEGRALADVCDQMLEEYDVRRVELEHDMLRLVEDLVAHGLVSPV